MAAVTEEASEASIDTFRLDVSEFASIDSQIKDLEKQIKPIKEKVSTLAQRKKELKVGICDFMSDNNVEKCNLENNGSIVFKQRKTKVPVKKDTIESEIKRFFITGPGSSKDFNSREGMDKALKMIAFIYEDPEYRVTDVLTRMV